MVELKATHHKLFFAFDLFSHVETFDSAEDSPARAKLYECHEESLEL